MAKLADQIKKDLVEAQKSGEKKKLDTLRLVFSEIKNKQIDSGKEVEDDVALQIISKEVKKRKDSIKAYKDGNRDDLAEIEEQEIEIISVYLPKQLSEEEVRTIVSKIVSENQDMDFGPLMGKVMVELKGKADGQIVKQILEEEVK